MTAIISIEIDDQLLADVLTDEWRSHFYPLMTAQDVAGHLAFNLVQDRKLQTLDGFADQPEDRSPKPSNVDLEIDEVEEVREKAEKAKLETNEKHPELWRALAPLDKGLRRRAYNILTGPQAYAKITSPDMLKSMSLQSLRMIKQLGDQSLRALAMIGLLSDEATSVLLP